MKSFGLVVAAMIAGLIPVAVAGAQVSPPDTAEMESGVTRTIFIDSGETVYNMSWSRKRFEKDGKTYLAFQLKGDNNTQGAERVEWKEDSLLELTPAGPRTVYWKKDSSGAEDEHWKLEYDWPARTLRYTYSDGLSGKSESRSLSFEEGAVPSDAMRLLLRGFPFEKGEGYQFRCQIILTDGKLLKGAIIHRGEEDLDTNFGLIRAYKLELKPSGVIGMVVPKMFMWYTKSKPHIWLRSDARDAGLLKPRTKNVLLFSTPREWIK